MMIDVRAGRVGVPWCAIHRGDHAPRRWYGRGREDGCGEWGGAARARAGDMAVVFMIRVDCP